MEGKSLTAITESEVFAIQEQEVAVKATRKEVRKEDIEDVSCRLCKTDKETVGHVLCGCPVLLRTQYYARHDAVMRVIYSKLLVMYGFETELKQWFRDDYVEKIKENEFCQLFWDFEFQTDSFVKYNKPDIVMMEKITKQILIIEGNIPGDMNLVERKQIKTKNAASLVLN